MSHYASVIKKDLIPLLTLAIPMVITSLVQSSLYFFETIFLSRLGEHALAAGALVSWLFAALIVIIFGTFGSINILIAHKHGANDKAGIALVLRDGFLLAILFAIPTFILVWNISSVFLVLKQSAELVTLATLYLHALAWGLFPKFILIVLFEFVVGLGHSRTIMIVTMLTIPLYILFSYTLIFGKFGLPALGIAGAGWGMTCADWIISIILSIALMMSKTYKPYLISIFSLKKPCYLSELVKLGLPMGAMYSIEVAFFLAAALIMGTIGIAALAANQVTMQYSGLLMGVIFSIAQAVTVRMGHQFGAKLYDDVKRTAITGVFISTSLMAMVAIIYWIIPQWLIAVDFDLQNPNNAKTIQIAIRFFYIAAFFQIFECIRISLFGALRALKDTRFTLLTSIICFWGIALPIGYLLAFNFNLSGNGIWCGMVIGAAISVIMLRWRFKHKMHRYLLNIHDI
jgi:multidrug resistance protein, MATE family